MARRWQAPGEDIFSRDDLKQMRQKLSSLSRIALLHAYQSAYRRCLMVNDRIPSALSIQELVQIWKQLRKQRGGIPRDPRA